MELSQIIIAGFIEVVILGALSYLVAYWFSQVNSKLDKIIDVTQAGQIKLAEHETRIDYLEKISEDTASRLDLIEDHTYRILAKLNMTRES